MQRFTVSLVFETLDEALKVAHEFDGKAADVSVDLGIEDDGDASMLSHFNAAADAVGEEVNA